MNPLGYYDRQGKPMTRGAYYAAVLESHRENEVYGPPIRVGWDVVGDVTVSTVWTGRAAHPIHPPDIFETLTWASDGTELERATYATEAEAVEGHRLMVAAVANSATGTGGER